MPRAALTLGFVALLTGLVAAQVGPAQGPTGLSPDQIALMCARYRLMSRTAHQARDRSA